VQGFQQRTIDLNPAQIQWQKAVNAIDTQDSATIDRRKANISKLIATLNEDDDIEEQQQALAAIRSITYGRLRQRAGIDLKPDDQNYSARFNTRRFDYQSQIHTFIDSRNERLRQRVSAVVLQPIRFSKERLRQRGYSRCL
jgi:hypothetical protein